MITPKNRNEFERNLSILVESALNRNVNLPPNRKLKNSLLSARYSPNRRMNFLTIDESTRLFANSLANFDKSDFKK